MQKRNAIIDIEYLEDRDVYKLSLCDFRYTAVDPTNTSRALIVTPAVYLHADHMPENFRDQQPIFEIGDHVDKNWRDPDDERGPKWEYAGVITEIKIEGSENQPKRVKYFTDIWYKGETEEGYHRTYGLRQDALRISLNPPID